MKHNKKSDKKINHIVKMGLFALALGIAGQYLLRIGAAASGPALFITPSSANVLIDNNFSVQLRLDTAGQQVDGVEAFLTYPADKLQYLSMSDSGSAFGLGFPSSGGGGNITVRRTVNPDVSPTVSGDNLLVVTVSFKALTGSGTAAVNYSAQSSVTAPSAGNGSVLSSTSGGTYTLTSAPPPSQPPPVSQPPAASIAPAPPASTQTPSGTTKTTPKQTNSTQSEANTPDPSTPEPPPENIPLAVSSEKPKGTFANLPNGKMIPMFAKIAGSLLILGSIFLAVRLIIAFRRHKIALATGIYYDSHFYNGKVPSDNLDKRIDTLPPNSKHSETDDALSAIATPKLPEPGTNIMPQTPGGDSSENAFNKE